MAAPFSLGDVATLLAMLNSIRISINGTRGSAADYQTTVKDLEQFLDDLNAIERAIIPSAQLLNSDLASSLAAKVKTSRKQAEEYRESIKRYEKALGQHEKKGNAVIRTIRMMQWHLWRRDEAVQQRQRLQADRTSLDTSLTAMATFVAPRFIF